MSTVKDRPFDISESNQGLLLKLEAEQSKLRTKFQLKTNSPEEEILKRIEDSDELVFVIPLANYLSGKKRLIPSVRCAKR